MLKSNSTTRMKFGKHQGKLISEIDDDYLRWILDNAVINRTTRNAINHKLGINKEFGDSENLTDK